MNYLKLVIFIHQKISILIARKMGFTQFYEFSFWYRNISIKRFISLSNTKEEHVSYKGLNFNLRPFTSDYLVFDQILRQKEYEPVFKLANLYQIPLQTMIDCGANIGLTSLYFKDKFPALRIYAIEPNQENFEILIKNLSIFNNIKTKKIAVWEDNKNL
jgi:hypothetical protein